MQESLGFKGTAGTVALMVAGLLLLIGSVGFGTADAAKKGKIKTCAAKKGEDKGLLRLAKKGKCKKSERKVVFNKKGKKGAAGATGATGATGAKGATGATGQPGVTSAELTTTVDSLRNQLTALTTQVETVVCPQLTLVTTQTGLIEDAIDAIDVLLAGTSPSPLSLPSFSCT